MRYKSLMKSFYGLVVVASTYQAITLWKHPAVHSTYFTRDAGFHLREKPTGRNVLLSGGSRQSKIEDKNIAESTLVAIVKPRSCYLEPRNIDGANYLGRLQRQMNSWHWNWISKRITDLWPHWVNGKHVLSREYFMQKRRRLKILIVPGVLTLTPYATKDFIQTGGALGDLLQWADLIAALHALGHDVQVTESIKWAVQLLEHMYDYTPSCETYDLIFGDYGAFSKFPASVLDAYKCKLRVIDAYGTEPAFNHRAFSEKKGWKFDVGKMSLNPKQMLTYYPHTPDNTFLGFVVPPRAAPINASRANIALLYGKNLAYFNGKRSLIRRIQETMEVHATLKMTGDLPSEVINHRLLKGPDYIALLDKAKVLVAVGRPWESSGAIEALARGAVILQPKFTGTRRGLLQGKPTSRQMSSQITYLENVVGPPNVYTVDFTDPEELDDALTEIASLKMVQPIHPREFSVEGMLEKLAVIFEEQDFCSKDPPQWPPLTSMQVHKSVSGDDCVQTCYDKGKETSPVQEK